MKVSIVRYIAGFRQLLCIATVVAIAASLVVGCGGGSDKKESGQTQNTSGVSREYYADWMKYKSRVFELRCPPREDIQNRLEAIGNKCDEIVSLLSMMLRTRPPEPIYMMIFPNRTEAENLLGRELPYASNDTIYYEILAPLGIGITDLMMHKVAPNGSRFDFVNEGFMALTDYSGENYHENVLQHLENGTLYSMDSLIDNETYRRLDSPRRREQAASFIGFLTYYYGSGPLVGLLREQISVNTILMVSTNKNLDVLEGEWKAVLPKLAKPQPAQPEDSAGTGGA
jgi:hypothetical protein